MKDLLFCEFCGKLVRHHSKIHRHYGFIWWNKWRLCICEDCQLEAYDEVEDDVPEHVRRFSNEDSGGT